jgi:MarR family transcriptional regulator, organic hydroperoxide resistance regulator
VEVTPKAPHPHPLQRLLERYVRSSVHEMHALLRHYDLTMPQMGALHALHAAGAQSVSALAAELGLSLPAASHLVERLVGRGYLTRDEDPDDRRQKRVALAPAGRQLVGDVRERASASLEALLEPVPSDLRERFLRDLGLILDALDSPAP